MCGEPWEAASNRASAVTLKVDAAAVKQDGSRLEDASVNLSYIMVGFGCRYALN